jgi:hypothetical protein
MHASGQLFGEWERKNKENGRLYTEVTTKSNEQALHNLQHFSAIFTVDYIIKMFVNIIKICIATYMQQHMHRNRRPAGDAVVAGMSRDPPVLLLWRRNGNMPIARCGRRARSVVMGVDTVTGRGRPMSARAEEAVSGHTVCMGAPRAVEIRGASAFQ